MFEQPFFTNIELYNDFAIISSLFIFIPSSTAVTTNSQILYENFILKMCERVMV